MPLKRLLCVLLLLAAGLSAQTAATMVSPTPGTSITTGIASFTWTLASGATRYSIWLGSTPDTFDLASPVFGAGVTSGQITVPVDGRTLYVKLLTELSGAWYSNSYVYTALDFHPISPAPGSTLPGSTVVFTWTSIPSATQYSLWFGSHAGDYDISSAPLINSPTTSFTWVGAPTTGITVYVRLFIIIGANTYANDYIYTAQSQVVSGRSWIF